MKSLSGKGIEKTLIKKLKSLSNPEAVAGTARFGINPNNTLGVSIPVLRKMAKEIGQNHPLAQRLWRSGIARSRPYRRKLKVVFRSGSYVLI